MGETRTIIPAHGVVVDDNDISNLPTGLYYEDEGYSGLPTINCFDLYTRNSLHDNAVGIGVSVTFENYPPIAWFAGNVFRGNSITGPAGPVNGDSTRLQAGILISGDPGDPAGNPAQALMTIFDQNTVSDYPVGILIAYNHDNNGDQGLPGIVDTVLANDFFSSDGSDGSIGLQMFAISNDGVSNDDPTLYYYFGDDTWQNFWDANSQENG